MRYSQIFAVIFLMAACACDSPTERDPDTDTPPINSDKIIAEAFPELSFNRPLNIQHSGDGTNRLFVEEQEGIIFVFENDSNTAEKTVFLDIGEQVTDNGNEQGLLGLAFHPDYESNGYFYVNYTAENSGRTVISRFSVSEENPDMADADSEVELLSFDQPYSNHNGGHLAFGPDGYLYIGVGDGGDAADPHDNGQDRTTLLGSILRIDVDNPEDEKQYGIPPDNPFADNEEGYREEIFAWGLRNPWRFSFDTDTGQLWVADVGQSDREEINIVENGLNYGWNIMEGSICFPPGSDCDMSGLELPVYEYNQDNGDRSITGGYVYRGLWLPEMEGYYIYADFISGRIWALNSSDVENSGDAENPENIELFHADFGISSFGTDQNNELYFCGFDGKIYYFEGGVLDLLSSAEPQ